MSCTVVDALKRLRGNPPEPVQAVHEDQRREHLAIGRDQILGSRRELADGAERLQELSHSREMFGRGRQQFHVAIFQAVRDRHGFVEFSPRRETAGLEEAVGGASQRRNDDEGVA